MTGPHPRLEPPRVSIIMPVRDEGAAVMPSIARLLQAVTTSLELLIIFDSVTDTTIPYVSSVADRDRRVRPLLNTYGPGPANAIRFGFDHATAPTVVVTMADGSDDLRQIDELVYLVERGAVVASASRYTPGGHQLGGSRLRNASTALVGLSLYLLAGVGTRDATNNFKAYSRAFVSDVGIDSQDGFEVALELVAKAARLGLPVADIPTTWIERRSGQSHFELWRWLPAYVRWYLVALSSRTTPPRLEEGR